jgi:quercetin dioxygenase-like cupin family protein
MPLVTQADAITHTTPNAVMRTYAGPRQGSAELSVWHLSVQPGASGPVHVIDREQVYLVTGGHLVIETGGQENPAGAGDAVIIPAGVTRQVRCPASGSGPATAVVSMAVGGRVTVDGEDRGLLPWAT